MCVYDKENMLRRGLFMYICSEGEERRKETVNRAAGVAVFAAGSFVS